ncbi:exosortase-dependent surface protein XDP2 [Jannaschia seohaensis]|nr:exosortase-dependent surface protein XDP2 [Jannaschia seohaensis]
MPSRSALSTLAVALASTAMALPAVAAVIAPSNITVSVPAGSNDPTGPVYTDDVLLETLTFERPGGGIVVYDASGGSFAAAQSFEVTGSRTKINAEWGDDDDGADGNDTPFAKAGYPLGGAITQETTDPTIQDAALLQAYNSLSLSEMTDGESGNGTMEFVTTFTKSLAYDDVGGDGLPDITFFERGGNDIFSIELIIGGSAANPIYSQALTMNSANFWGTGISVDTLEISSPQQMFVGGFDFSDWGLSSGDIVGGFRLNTTGGPDLGGFFLAAEDPNTFGAPFPVPLPAGGLLLIGGLAGLGALRSRRKS